MNPCVNVEKNPQWHEILTSHSNAFNITSFHHESVFTSLQRKLHGLAVTHSTSCPSSTKVLTFNFIEAHNIFSILPPVLSEHASAWKSLSRLFLGNLPAARVPEGHSNEFNIVSFPTSVSSLFSSLKITVSFSTLPCGQ